MEAWRATLSEAIALGSEHLSSYEVIYEEDTPLYAQLQAGEFDVDEDLACDMYDALIQGTGEHGFVQYEIANFARHIRTEVGQRCPQRAENVPNASLHPRRAEDSAALPGLACCHNVNYWRGGSFYGIGPSATGYVRGVRTKNWSNTQLYCEQLEKGRRAIESSEQLPSEARAGEIAAFGLRMNTGWRFEEFQQVTGFDLRENWASEMREFIDRGWAETDEEGFRLNRSGLRFADSAAEAFLRLQV
jgi:oxygen-independent coproporphyrinogen-3 oxidase